MNPGICPSLCCFTPSMASVGVCAATGCGAGVTNPGCGGMSTVTVTAGKPSTTSSNMLLMVAAIGIGAWLLFGRRRRA